MLTSSAADWSAWQFQQSVQAEVAGLTRLRLPNEIVDASRPGFTDLRLADAEDAEVPFSLIIPSAPRRSDQIMTVERNDLRIRAEPERTVIEFRGALDEAVDGISFTISNPQFYKSATVLTAAGDSQTFVEALKDVPIFRQGANAVQLHIPVELGGRDRVRIEFDDRRSDPVAVTQITVHGLPQVTVPAESVAARIIDREERNGETRLSLDVGAAWRYVAWLDFTVAETAFTRPVRLIDRAVVDGEVTERVVAAATIWRQGDRRGSEQLRFVIERPTTQRELILAIDNGDSPPLGIDAIGLHVRPLHLLFAAQPGDYRLRTGNRRAPAPQYDLARLGHGLSATTAAATTAGPFEPNPNYSPADELADVPLLGADLDVSDWSYRKALPSMDRGIQRLALDLDVLAHAQPALGDLRLLAGTRQVPYVLERTSRTRSVAIAGRPAPDPKRPSVSRWELSLPHAGLPLRELSCRAGNQLFNRTVALYETATNLRGEPYRRHLGAANWVRVPGSATGRFALKVDVRPETDTLFLETDNGDNAAVELSAFEVSVPETRMLFRSPGGAGLSLYYGNPRAVRPAYDLALLATDVMWETPRDVAAGVEERLAPEPWKPGQVSGGRAVLFWSVLALVVAGLLFVIMRLLPKAE